MLCPNVWDKYSILAKVVRVRTIGISRSDGFLLRFNAHLMERVSVDEQQLPFSLETGNGPIKRNQYATTVIVQYQSIVSRIEFALATDEIKGFLHIHSRRSRK